MILLIRRRKDDSGELEEHTIHRLVGGAVLAAFLAAGHLVRSHMTMNIGGCGFVMKRYIYVHVLLLCEVSFILFA